MSSVCKMRQFGLLLLTASLSSFSDARFQQIFMDASNCIHLLCEWRGEGEHCKSANSLPRDGSGWTFRFLNEGESDADFLAHIKRRHPLNTFTIVKNVALGEMCKKRLWCNAASQFYSEGFDEFFAYLQHPILSLRPKLQC